MKIDIQAVVETARSMLQGDGYDIELTDYEPGELKLTVVAGSDACEDCLVPKNVLSNIIASTLPVELAATRITLTYPSDHA